MKIQNIDNQILNLNPISKSPQSSEKKQAFENVLDTIGAIEKNQIETKNSVTNLLKYGQGSTHDVLMAMQKAEGTIKTAAMVRDKLVQAYQEIMRTQL